MRTSIYGHRRPHSNPADVCKSPRKARNVIFRRLFPAGHETMANIQVAPAHVNNPRDSMAISAIVHTSTSNSQSNRQRTILTRECSALWGEPERATEVYCRLSSTIENGVLSLIFRRTRSFASLVSHTLRRVWLARLVICMVSGLNNRREV